MYEQPYSYAYQTRGVSEGLPAEGKGHIGGQCKQVAVIAECQHSFWTNSAGLQEM